MFSTIDNEATREYLAGELMNEIEHKRNTTQVLRRESLAGEDFGPEYILKPMTDRFSDDFEAKSSYASFCGAFEKASELYIIGQMITLTTDPKRFDSIEEMYESLMKNKTRFMQWLKDKLGRDTVPTNLHVVEFTDTGLPHLHLCVFGVHVSEVPSEADVSEYWGETRDQGSEVDCQRIQYSTGRDRWIMGSGADLQYYLAKTYNDMMAVASGETEPENFTHGWKLALYWCMEIQVHNGSQVLMGNSRDDDENGDNVKFYSYEFVGAANIIDIPAHITNKATWISDLEVIDKTESDPPPCSSRYIGHPLEDQRR
ncbi:hypothetical protein B1756_17030 [Natrarchaeobaculum aegyptiacum]|uniref:Replication protein n=2 Tax=Natrarchaeobaculum aegyptiacum TaxID=745377 RepID=A0A2Z2HZ89_9EURY|nr:hypothetical protein B1756_17030 [Natrarchaeobaculum aegyptiacum]